MEVVEYKGFHICINYFNNGTSHYYTLWTKDYVDLVCDTFKSIKSARKYIKEELISA